jgi:hypothetical protein
VIPFGHFLASDIVTYAMIKSSDVGFGYPNDIRPFLSMGMKAMVPATCYLQPKEKPLPQALDRD